MVRREDRGRCRDCKVIPSEWEEEQHKLVIMDFWWVEKEQEGQGRIGEIEMGYIEEEGNATEGKSFRCDDHLSD